MGTKKENATNVASSEQKFSFTDLLNQCTENLSTNKGNKRDSVYLPSIYEGCSTTDEKKQRRKKIRNCAEKFCSDIISTKDESKLKKLVADFLQFYKLCYINNDYTISSIASKNTNSLQLENYKKMFIIIEKVNANK